MTTSWDRPHVVLCQKVSGARVVFSRYRDRKAAELVASQLRNVGCPCTVEIARPGDVAGLTRREGRGASAPREVAP